jgi:hypothetical protein
LLADVVLLLAAQKGMELYGELHGSLVMAGERLGTDLMDLTIEFDLTKDLGGVEKGVEYDVRMIWIFCGAMSLFIPILAKVWPRGGR